MKKRILVALGGNALDNPTETPENQKKAMDNTASMLCDIVEKGHQLVITHGNGPQVGKLCIQNEASEYPSSFDLCVAMSQGMIGYPLQQAIQNVFAKRHLKKQVVALISQVVVDRNDPAFNNPNKPIGPFYSKEEAEKLKLEKGYDIVEDSGRGYRRVVASPIPRRIHDLDAISHLMDNGWVVIAAGGGGIPVFYENFQLEGTAAVIDKDRASTRLALDLNIDKLVILTAVEHVCVNFGTPQQKNLTKLSLSDAKRYIQEKQFAPGSMLPKVESAVDFVMSNPTKTACIGELSKIKEIIQGTSGTQVYNDR